MKNSSEDITNNTVAGKTIRVFNDPIWGLHANVPPAETAKILLAYRRSGETGVLLNEEGSERLRSNGCDLILFGFKNFKNVRRLLYSDYEEIAEASPEENAERAPYSPQLCKLISLGEPRYELEATPADYYRSLGITGADIPELMRMFSDREIVEGYGYGNADGDYSDCPQTWTQAHVQRALFELRAEIPPLRLEKLLLEDIRDAGKDAFMNLVPYDSKILLQKIGSPAFGVLETMLEKYAEEPGFCIDMAELAAGIAESHSHLREKAIAINVRLLKNFLFNEHEENAYLILSLVYLKAVEAAPLIEKAFAANAVNLFICSDWEDVQVSLGLKTERDTPHQKWTYEEMRRRKRSNFDAIDAGKDMFDTDEENADDDFIGTGTDLIPELPFIRAQPKIGRNDPCPCGSGKKYKKCCLNKTE